VSTATGGSTRQRGSGKRAAADAGTALLSAQDTAAIDGGMTAAEPWPLDSAEPQAARGSTGQSNAQRGAEQGLTEKGSQSDL
jgi:hypothetical protein